MKIVEGRVVKGAIVTAARFRDGAHVTIIQHDDRPPVKLARDEEADVRGGIRELEEGKGLPVEGLRAQLRRHRSAR